MSKNKSHIATGARGEDLACAYLVEKGYKILERNVRRKWGEIDVVCRVPRGTSAQNQRKSVPRGTLWGALRKRATQEKMGRGKLVFIEVKTMRSHALRPEENMTRGKQKRVIRTCQLYLTESGYSLDMDWQIDVIAVVLHNAQPPTIRHIERAVY